MIRVLALPRFTTRGASSRYRTHTYIPYLQAHGISVDVVPFLGDDYLSGLYRGWKPSLSLLKNAYTTRIARLLGGRSYDLVWIEGESLPWIPGIVESMLLNLGAPYILDYDDALFHRYDSHDRMIVRWALGKKISRLMRHASLVIAGNDYIADYAQKAGASRIGVLPTVVDLEKYDLAPARTDGPIRIGWIGTPLTARQVQTIHPALQEVCRDGSARLTLVGAGGIQFDGVPFEVRNWSEATEVAEIQRFDVGIMPLSLSDPIQRGKCGLKLIQYMACGIPVIGTPLGVNADIIQNDLNGFQATTRDEWITALNAMKASPEQRRRMGLSGRRMVEERYSLQMAVPRLVELLQQAAEPGVRRNQRRAA